jgi:PBP1b-binding outer membrane lipoprotein LpoB
MMTKRVFCLAMLLIVSAFFLISCSGSKGPAEMAMKAAEEAVNLTKTEAVKIAPEEVQSLEDALVSLKEKFMKKEYKVVLQEAAALSEKAKDVLAKANIKREELTQKWTDLNQGFPGMLEDMKSEVDKLSKLKKLPSNVTKEALSEAKSEIASMEEEWTKAKDNFTGGNLNDAVSVANALKEKALKVMESLGIKAPEAAL